MGTGCGRMKTVARIVLVHYILGRRLAASSSPMSAIRIVSPRKDLDGIPAKGDASRDDWPNCLALPGVGKTWWRWDGGCLQS